MCSYQDISALQTWLVLKLMKTVNEISRWKNLKVSISVHGTSNTKKKLHLKIGMYMSLNLCQ